FMKRFLCAGEGYALFPMKVTPVRGNYLMRCTVAIILFFGLPIMVGTTPVVAKESLTGGALDSIQHLQIGDTIPEGLWHLRLALVIHYQGRKTITLDAYRGKTILLDFLSTGCSGCIAALPKLEGLRDEFTGELFVLPVTGQTRETVAAFLPKNKYTADLNLPFIVEDSILKAYFPHLY